MLIATVTKIDGNVFVKKIDGTIHKLTVGDKLETGDIAFGADDKSSYSVEYAGNNGTMTYVGIAPQMFDPTLIPTGADGAEGAVEVASANPFAQSILTPEELAALIAEEDEKKEGDKKETTAGEEDVKEGESQGDSFADRTGAITDVNSGLRNAKFISSVAREEEQELFKREDSGKLKLTDPLNPTLPPVEPPLPPVTPPPPPPLPPVTPPPLRGTLDLSGDTSVPEGGSATYTLRVSEAPKTPLVVTIQIGHITTEDGDLIPRTITVTIPVGVTSVTFPILNNTDTIYEDSEDYRVHIVSTSGGDYNQLTIGNDTVITTIQDDDETVVSISALDDNAVEGTTNNTLVFQVSQTNVSEYDTDVIVTLDLGEVEAADVNSVVTYLDAAGNPATTTIAALQGGLAITIPANSTYTPTFTITALDDTIFERHETLTMNLALAGGEIDATLGVSSDTGTIYDEVELVDDSATVVEGSNTITHTTFGNLLANDETGDNGSITSYTYLGEDDLIHTGAVGVATDTKYGTLTLYSDGTWSYVSDPSESHGTILETITYTVTDTVAGSSTADFVITVTDTTPTAVADINTLTENTASVTGNVYGVTGASVGDHVDSIGADTTAAPVTGVVAGTNTSVPVSGNVASAVSGDYGSVTIGTDGAYMYSLNTTDVRVQHLANGETLTDSFVYTITDSDGDTSTTTLTITITGTDDAPSITPDDMNGALSGHAIVYEAGLATGSTPSATTETTNGTIVLSAKDGLTSVSIGGTIISQADLLSSGSSNVTINTGEGSLVINGFTPTDATHQDGSGTINYTYTLTARQTHAAGAGNNELTDVIALIVTDRDGDTANGTLNVTIVDDVPTANDDTTTTLAENGVTVTDATEGNLLANDIIGADATGAYINQITYMSELNVSTNATITSGGSVTVDTKNGSLTVYSDGRWSFTSDGTVDNSSGPLTESFTYQLRDGDNDIATATKAFSITDRAPSIGTPVNAVVYEASLSTGTNPSATTEVDSQTLNVTGGGDSFDTTFNLPTVLSGLKAGGHDVTYSVSGDGHTLTASANGNTVFTVVITNPTTASAGYTFTLVRPLDHTATVNGDDGTIDLPFAFKVTDSDGSTVNNTFNVTVHDDIPALSQTLTVNEEGTTGAHNTSTTINTNADATQANTIITTDGTYGHAVINANGTLTYTPSYNGTTSIATNYSGADTVVYTTTLDDGTTRVTTVTVTVNPISDAPGVTRDAATVLTLEDTAIALGLNAPTITDATDHNGASAGDNPERLSAITLSGIPSGVVLTYGASTYTSTGAAITVVLSDGSHISGATGTLTMTTAQFEAMTVTPVPQSGVDFTVTMSVTEYEVNDSHVPIVAGVTSSTTVAVDVLAVTDPVDLKINGSDTSYDLTINEDASFDLKALLSTAPFVDLDGSETRTLIISNLPTGTFVNGTAITGTTATFTLTGGTTIPAISIKPPLNFSGDMAGISIKLKAHDSDTDSTKTDSDTVGTTTLGNTTIYNTEDTVTLNLYVDPIAGDVTSPDVTTPEDTAVKFLATTAVTDTDGSESITAIEILNLRAGWVIKDHNGNTVFTGDGATEFSIPSGDVTSLAYKNYTVTPPAHSSLDYAGKIQMNITTVDTQTVHGSPVTSTVTALHDVGVTVTAVSETKTTNTDGVNGNDVESQGNHTYTAHASEDTWFNLNTADGGFALAVTNEDSETTLINFSNVAIGTQFKYNDGAEHILTVSNVSTGIDIPLAYLGTVQVLPSAQYSGSVSIDMKIKTTDHDEDTGVAAPTAISSADILTFTVDPAADNITFNIAQSSGFEDAGRSLANTTETGIIDQPQNGIALHLGVISDDTDGSETFTIRFQEIPDGGAMYYVVGGHTYLADGVSIYKDGVIDSSGTTPFVITDTGASWQLEIKEFENTTSNNNLTFIPPLNSNGIFDLKVSGKSVDGADESSYMPSTPLSLKVDVKGVADIPMNDDLKELDSTGTSVVNGAYAVVANEDDDSSDHIGNSISLSSIYASGTPDSFDNSGATYDSEKLTIVISGLDASFDVVGATSMGGSGTSRQWIFDAVDIANVKITTGANYSGEIPFTLKYITTENDGNSKTHPIQNVTLLVTPDAEATISLSTTVNEDTLTKVNLDAVQQNGETGETLGNVWIKVTDVSAKAFTLYLDSGATTNISTLTTETIGGDSYYKLTPAQANSLYIKYNSDVGSADTSDKTFAIKYTTVDSVTTTHSGTLSDTSTVSDATYSIDLRSVTDQIDATLGTISATVPADISVTGSTITVNTNTTITVPIVVTAQTNDNGDQDKDGSEKITRLMIEGVPHGVTVENGYYAGSVHVIGDVYTEIWYVDIPDQAFTAGNSGVITYNLVLHVGGDDATYVDNSTVTVTAYNQDVGASEVSDTVQFNLNKSGSFTENSPTTDVPMNIDDTNGFVVDTTFAPHEDGAFSLADATNINVSNAGATSNTFSITIYGIENATLSGAGLTSITQGGQTVYSFQGSGTPADIQTAMQNLIFTPTANINANDGAPYDVKFTATLTTYADGGALDVMTVNYDKSLTPVTDVMSVAATETNGSSLTHMNEDTSHAFKINLSTVDNSANDTGVDYTISGNALSITHSGTTYGTLSWDGGSAVFDASNHTASIPVDKLGALTFTPAHDLAGTATFNYTITHTETNAPSSVTTTGSFDIVVDPVADGMNIPASASGDEDTYITLIPAGLTSTDSSEVIQSITLEDVPNGFLVFYGDSNIAANNAGGDPTTWVIPVSGANPKVSIKAPEHWSGTQNITVKTDVQDGAVRQVASTSVALTVIAVADTLTMLPTQAIGSEGQDISINLNAMAQDLDGSETMTLTLSGLGAGAIFKENGVDHVATYDSSNGGTYTLSGINVANINNMTFSQIAAELQSSIGVTAHMIETSNGDIGTAVTASFTAALSEATATTGDDTLRFKSSGVDGLAGTDTMVFATNENVDFTGLGDIYHNIEKLDLTRSGNHTITLDPTDVAAMNTPKSLDIVGDGSDSVVLKDVSYTDVWIDNGGGNYTSSSTGAQVHVTGGTPVTLSGTNDSIAGTAGNDTLYGGAGNDTFTALAGNDTINAGTGNDTITFGLTSADTIDGGTGTDTLIFTNTGNISFAGLNNLTNIEKINLSGTQNITNLSLDQVFNMTDSTSSHTLTIDGVAGGTEGVSAVTKTGWTKDTESAAGGYTSYTYHNNATPTNTVTLKIDTDLANTTNLA